MFRVSRGKRSIIVIGVIALLVVLASIIIPQFRNISSRPSLVAEEELGSLNEAEWLARFHEARWIETRL